MGARQKKLSVKYKMLCFVISGRHKNSFCSPRPFMNLFLSLRNVLVMILQGGIVGMRKVIVLLLLLLVSGTARAQIYEVGLQGGISAYKGDLNPVKTYKGNLNLDNYFYKIHGAGGIMVRYNHNKHVSARINGTYTILRGSDLSNKQPYVIVPPLKQYEFETQLVEVSLQAEVNFLPFTAGNMETRFTPYLFGGFGGIYYNPTSTHTGDFHTDEDNRHWYGGSEPSDFSNFSVISLFGFGFKFNIAEDFSAGVEWGMRYAGLPGNRGRGTDYLDMVSLKGNPKNNDWYSIVGLSFTYKFLDRSQPPCPIYDY